jgi:hypothetical protein
MFQLVAPFCALGLIGQCRASLAVVAMSLETAFREGFSPPLRFATSGFTLMELMTTPLGFYTTAEQIVE